MVAMRYQLNDLSLQADQADFNTCGYACCLKPDALRYIPEVIDAPPEQNANVTYANKNITNNYYSLSV